MKNKRLLFITIGLFMTIVCLLAINVLFPASKINKKEILLTRNSTLNEYFKNENIRIIPDSELNFYEIEERDIKTTDELNEDKEAKRNYEKTYFMYNINNQEIEIVGYKGSNPNLIIPSNIVFIPLNSPSKESKVSCKISTIKSYLSSSPIGTLTEYPC